MESFICTNCNYKFKALKSTKTCPYCDKKAIEKEKTAEDLIEEVENG